ncbi:DUF4232 domain-containing protein [Streptomyces termitum]|uniref:DUF4232 domain-containing protein n=1 Tax=Streptomyces termitum TaxID=67368 RepID=A0A918T817_9ACTN|nr:DUF4232 domain-containing protein [Streptomyces termitum]GHB08053.1 hypothetical protein GCM10010305_58860 [Streptomyces termitum]
MRLAREILKTCALGAAAVAAVLSTAACGPGGGAEGAGAPSSGATGTRTGTTPSASAAPDDAPSSPAAPTTAPGKSGGGKGKGTGGGSGDVGGDGVPGTPCTDDTFTITASSSPHDSLQHLLLTATHTGDEPCVLGGYPAVTFGDARHRTSLMPSQLEEFLVRPGGKAYAGVRLFRTGAPTDAVEKMGVSLSPEGYEQDVALPAGAPFLNVDAAPEVTYWTGSESLAVRQSLAD